MHSSFLLLMLAIAVVWRWQWQSPTGGSWQARWQSALAAFCLPPLMVVLAAGTVLYMGHHGTMMGWSVSPMGCWASRGILGLLGGVGIYALGQAVKTEWWLQQQPMVSLPTGGQARCLDIDLPVAALVGVTSSSLLVSRGWLEQLTLAEQQAMVAHEQAHGDCGDPLWFLGLGIIHRFASWWPNNQALWEELLLLREIRADQRAAITHDPLLLAELLVSLCRQMALLNQGSPADLAPYLGFNESLCPSRLEQRVNALLDPEVTAAPSTLRLSPLPWLIAASLPLAAPWFHT
ncbi:M56 family peptidase [Nodosilinea sp. P-1105]|uniref:M56 family peptidase n=1 Tax=Nodosilinea sp. P-1105 TaxID=2546229 RepID=UPI00146B052E|nr:M56 family peptidase [Nodosilinea sp. P-1105]NMF83089.1 M56 family peptidase [Nodosilinea sp. P-1105]